MRLWTAVILTGGMLASAPPAAVAGIRLEVRPGCELSGGRVRVTLRITNRGDEPACDVRAEAALNAARAVTPARDTLEPGRTMPAALALGAPPMPPGEYTVPIKVHYTDPRGYPFCTVHTVPLVTALPDGPPEQRILSVAAGPPVTVRDAGTVALRIGNASSEPATLTARIVLPDTLSGDAAPRTVTLPAGSDRRLEFDVERGFARPGSVYPLTAVVDVVWDGLHRSTTARPVIRFRPLSSVLTRYRPAWIGLLVCLAVAVALYQTLPARLLDRLKPPPSAAALARAWIVPALLSLLVLSHLAPRRLLTDTLTVGGDTPAHTFLAEHLRRHLFGEGRIVAWSHAWWGGFPAFQFYFPLPYLAAALLSLALPLNVAFKLVSVSGAVALPLCAYAAARVQRLARPTAAAFAAAMVLLLFDRHHTMWGVNLYSTLAGMISNSISFALMVLFLGCAVRDADDGRFRLHTSLLYAAVLASHFFTSIVAALALTVVPLLRPRAGARKAFLVLAGEGLLAALLTAWWLVPLIAKREFAMDFGTNWAMDYPKLLTPFNAVLAALAATGLSAAFSRDAALTRFVRLHVVLFLTALVLFLLGYGISPVFVNVRLWPFMVYAFLALAAVGTARIAGLCKARGTALAAIVTAALLWGTPERDSIVSWADWNYEGAEKKPRWGVLQDLVLPLAGTPGRLANDLHPRNDVLGSSRIFEAAPLLAGKPILEGGLVNSAAGSMFAYYIQSETSELCAGFPPIVTPTNFNIQAATRHLELFNVKHFIARSPTTQNALEQDKRWRRIARSSYWELHELTTHDGAMVFIPRYEPATVAVTDWKQAAMDWMYRTNLVDRFFVLASSPARDRPAPADAFRNAAADARPSFSPTNAVTDIRVSDHSIRFRTAAPGAPHIVKCNYFPNWKVRGADGIRRVTPNFMLVYPTQPEVELYYGFTLSDTIGRGLTLAGVLAVAALLWRRGAVRGHRDDPNPTAESP